MLFEQGARDGTPYHIVDVPTSFKLVDQSTLVNDGFMMGGSGGFGDNAMDVVAKNKWRAYDEIMGSLDELILGGIHSPDGRLLGGKNGTSWLDIHATF